MGDMVVKTNRLNTATQNLTLPEVRIMQLAIVDARETGQGLSTDKPLTISASRYAEAFNVSRQTAWEAIKESEKTLFDRRFSFIDSDGQAVKSRWLQRVKYLDGQASIEIILTFDVVNEITRIDGYEQIFTQYLLKQTSTLKSAYSVRLYELLVQWKVAKHTPMFELAQFREQLGVDPEVYPRIFDFQKYVIKPAIKEINEKTDIKTEYKAIKKGAKIIGFSFSVKLQDNPKNKKKEGVKIDNGELFTPEGLTDKQLWRITRHKQFISRFGSLASQSASQNFDVWSQFFVNKIKQEPELFNKTIKGETVPLGWYLDRPNDEYQF